MNIEYEVIERRTGNQLESAIENMRARGWNPVGGMTFNSRDMVYAILIMKASEDNDHEGGGKKDA